MSRPAKTQLAILGLLQQHHALTGPAMVQAMAQQGYAVNKSTVYRCLEKLLSQGQIYRFDVGQGEFFYEQRQHHHDHAVCLRCGDVHIVDCEDSGSRQPDLTHTQVPGFAVDHHHLTFFGWCDDCRQQ